MLAPDFSATALQPYFEHVVTIPTGSSVGRQGSPASVALTWLGRMRKVTATVRDLAPDLVHSTGDFFVDTLPAVFARGRERFAWSGNIHHLNPPPLQRRNHRAVAAASFALQRISFAALKHADDVLLLNNGVRSELISHGFAPSRLSVVGAGIDIARFPFMPLPPVSRRILWLNRLEPTKGLFDLPEILRHMPSDSVIDVVGNGPQISIDRLDTLLRKAAVRERCHLHGFLPEARVLELLAQAAVFISCSYEEGWGISIAEALATGVPCVAYDLPSHREIFDDLITRVPVGDTAAFAKAVTAQLDARESPEVRAQRRASVERFSLDECARRQEAVFERLTVAMSAVSDRV